MKINRHSFWFWFFGFIILYTTYDYIKHLMYDDSSFLEHAFQWFLFTFSSAITISVIIYGVYFSLRKVFNLKHFAFDGVGVALAIIVHINITGPLFNRLFWPHDMLHFFFTWTPLFIIVGAFYILRIGFYYFVERPQKETSL